MAPLHPQGDGGGVRTAPWTSSGVCDTGNAALGQVSGFSLHSGMPLTVEGWEEALGEGAEIDWPRGQRPACASDGEAEEHPWQQ